MVYKFPYRIVNINKYIRHDKYLQDIASKDSHIAELVAPKNKPKVTHIAVFQWDDLYSSSMSRERIIYDSNEKEVVHSKLFSDSHLCMANLNSYIIDEWYNVLENVNGITGESVLFRIYLNK